MTDESLEALMRRIDATEITAQFAPRPFSLDWGNKRPRPRHGWKGAAHDGPRGVVTYPGTSAALTDDEKLDLSGSTLWMTVWYLRARSAGLSHDEAILLVWHREGSLDAPNAWALLQNQKENHAIAV